AFLGDHRLAKITSGAETTQSDLPAGGRRRALYDYLTGLRLTAAMDLRTSFTGHGPVITDAAGLIEERFTFHRQRLDRIEAIVDDGVRTAFEIERRIWSDEVDETQTVLAL